MADHVVQGADKSVPLERVTRNERKKQKELEEARKAGTAPPEVDEEGRDINPHLPQYIVKVPWYFGVDRPTLKHQRQEISTDETYSVISETYIKGKPVGEKPVKYIPGSCENCGSRTHKKKDCLERPRALGAKYTNEDLAPDDYEQPDLKLSFDGKRDRWMGYDPAEHLKVIDEYRKVETAKQQLKAIQLEEDLEKGVSSATSKKAAGLTLDDDLEDEDKYAEESSMPGQKYDTKHRTTVRNLRIREDTAKYLLNLDSASAFYDPKSRSMRENPLKDSNKIRNTNFVGENFTRSSGEVVKVANAQLFAWEAYDKGIDVHLQADPTKAELLLKNFEQRKETLTETKKSSILYKYGGEEHLHAPPIELLLAQTEEYIEYSRTGKVIKGQEKAPVKSKYEEDVYRNNHTSVWGSYWKDFKWAYACCHSFIKNSYCTGKLIDEEHDQVNLPLEEFSSDQQNSSGNPIFTHEGPDGRGKTLLQIHQDKLNKQKNQTSSLKIASHDIKGELLSSLNQNEEIKALKRKQRGDDAAGTSLFMTEAQNHAYDALLDGAAPTEEEMEEYLMKRQRREDPMANFQEGAPDA